jgi:hypothetical protein
MTKQQYEKAVTALRENHRSMIFDEDYGEYVARVFYAARFWIVSTSASKADAATMATSIDLYLIHPFPNLPKRYPQLNVRHRGKSE